MIENLFSKIEQNKFLKILIACGGFLFVCVFITLKAHATTVVSGELPYIVPNFQSINTAISDSLIYSARNQMINDGIFTLNDTVLFYVLDLRDNLGQYEWNTLYCLVNPVVQTDISGEYNYITTNITLSCDKIAFIEFKWNNSFRSSGYSISNASLLGNVNTIDISNGSYTPRYPFYLIGDDIMYGDIVVFTNTVNQGPVPIEGHATAPTFGGGSGVNGSDFLGTGADFGASLSQATMPQAPTYNNFNFGVFSPPSFDDSSILDALDSIAQILLYTGNYIVSNVLGAFSTLMGNIIKIGEYIAGVLEYIGRSIITNIQNAVQNLYENIVSLFEPLLNSINELIDGISQKLDYISQPFDASVIQDSFESTALHSDIDSISQFTDTAFGIFDSTNEPNEFKIPLHLENIALFNISQVQYIDLGCINPVKSAIRAVMWCLTTFSLLYTVIDAIPSYINGGDE